MRSRRSPLTSEASCGSVSRMIDGSRSEVLVRFGFQGHPTLTADSKTRRTPRISPAIGALKMKFVVCCPGCCPETLLR